MGEQMFMTLRDQDDWLNSQAAVWYEEVISKLVSRYDKCLNVQDDYVEKYVKVCDKICIFCFFPIINKYLCMAKRSLLSRCPSYTNCHFPYSQIISYRETVCLGNSDFSLSSHFDPQNGGGTYPRNV